MLTSGDENGNTFADINARMNTIKRGIANYVDDYIRGIISAAPGVVGNNYGDVWQGMHKRDVFGEVITHMVHHDAEYVEREVTDPETGETTTEQVLIHEAYDAEESEINPNYDPTEKYIPR